MLHNEFENEFEHDIKFIFDELDKFKVSKRRKNIFENIKEIIAELNPVEREISDRNNQARRELLSEKQLIIRLCKMDSKCGQSVNERVRLLALRAAQKKIKSSTERHELELLNDYLNPLTISAFLALCIIIYAEPISSFLFPSNPISTEMLISTIQKFGVVFGIFLFFAKTRIEVTEKSILARQKRHLEIVEQTIELAQTSESTKE
jgi:hypothetical protein